MTRPAVWLARSPAPGDACTAVLVDGPVAGDRRVERTIAEQPGGVVVVDVSAQPLSTLTDVSEGLQAAWLVVSSLKGWRQRRTALERALGEVEQQPPHAGVLACFRQARRAVRGARLLRGVLDRYSPHRIHANDLTAGLSLALARPSGTPTRIYDAHELELHRHRKVGWLRLLIEHGLEQRAVRAATEVRTVCRPIAERLSALYPGIECRVHPNDLFEHQELEPAAAEEAPALVYVGRGARGRRLELLSGSRSQLGFGVHVWLLRPQDCAHLPHANWHFSDSVDYESELFELVRTRRTLMWCCLDTRSLSYRLALPNKFFQALAACVPIVASPGSYLAEVVERHGIGVVHGAGDLSALKQRVQGSEYLTWVANVRTLRSQLRSGVVVL